MRRHQPGRAEPHLPGHQLQRERPVSRGRQSLVGFDEVAAQFWRRWGRQGGDGAQLGLVDSFHPFYVFQPLALRFEVSFHYTSGGEILPCWAEDHWRWARGLGEAGQAGEQGVC